MFFISNRFYSYFFQLRIKFKDNLEDVYEYQSEASMLRQFMDQEFDSIDSQDLLQSSDLTTNGHSETEPDTDKSVSGDQPPPVPKRTKPRAGNANGPLRNNTVIGSMSGNDYVI